MLCTNMGMGGGAEEQVIHLSYALKARGWEVCIVSMLPPSPMPPDFKAHGIPLMDLGMRRGLPDPRAVTRLVRIIRAFRPDVVHSHMNHANLLARAARIVQRFPVLVGTLHALTMAGVDRDRTRVFEVAHRLSDRLSERTTAICHAAADYYVRRRAVPATKMMVVPNGIDTVRFERNLCARGRLRAELGLEHQFVWLAVGRLVKAKAYDTMLRAFARFAPDTAATLLICGHGSLREELVALRDELALADRVQFLGLRSDIPEVMSAADGFVLSSDSEGLPLVLLQAAACSLPIVATDVGGNGEAVIDGENGYLVPPGDSAALARAMSRLAALPKHDRAALGEAGRVRTKELFETERVVDRWEALYTELLRGLRLDWTQSPEELPEQIATASA